MQNINNEMCKTEYIVINDEMYCRWQCKMSYVKKCNIPQGQKKTFLNRRF